MFKKNETIKTIVKAIKSSNEVFCENKLFLLNSESLVNLSSASDAIIKITMLINVIKRPIKTI